MKENNNEATSIEKELDNLLVPEISKGLEGFLDIPLNLYPGFVDFMNSFMNCADTDKKLAKAEVFCQDFFTYMRKVKYSEDVEGFTKILKQGSLTSALAIVSKHKNIVAEKIDKDVFLGNEVDSYDIFFRNSLQRLYEDLNNHRNQTESEVVPYLSTATDSPDKKQYSVTVLFALFMAVVHDQFSAKTEAEALKNYGVISNRQSGGVYRAYKKQVIYCKEFDKINNPQCSKGLGIRLKKLESIEKHTEWLSKVSSAKQKLFNEHKQKIIRAINS